MENKVKWGVLGTAGIAKTQTIPGMMQADNCELYAIAGRSEDKVNEFVEKFGFQKGYISYDDLLADDKVEAVYIPLPNNLHKEWILKAAKAGKHILCEKPMVPTEEEVLEVMDACEEAGVVLMEAYAYLHSDIVKDMVARIQDGVIGEPEFMETVFYTGKPGADDIRWKRENFGGALYDLGCYNVSLSLRVFGEEPGMVRGVGRFTKEHVDEFSMISMEFSKDKSCTCGAGMCCPQRGDRWFIYGTKGTMEANINYNQEGLCSYDIIRDGKRDTISMTVKSNYALEVEQLGRCILSSETPWVSNEFSRQVAHAMDMALQAIQY